MDASGNNPHHSGAAPEDNPDFPWQQASQTSQTSQPSRTIPLPHVAENRSHPLVEQESFLEVEFPALHQASTHPYPTNQTLPQSRQFTVTNTQQMDTNLGTEPKKHKQITVLENTLIKPPNQLQQRFPTIVSLLTKSNRPVQPQMPSTSQVRHGNQPKQPQQNPPIHQEIGNPRVSRWYVGNCAFHPYRRRKSLSESSVPSPQDLYPPATETSSDVNPSTNSLSLRGGAELGLNHQLLPPFSQLLQSNEGSYQQHQQTVQLPGNSQDPIPAYVDTASHPARYLKRRHSDGRFQCTQCWQHFYREEWLFKHETAAHGMPPGPSNLRYA